VAVMRTIYRMITNPWKHEKPGIEMPPVETLHGHKHVAVLDSGRVALIGLNDPDDGANNGFWIQTIEGYDQGETVPFSELYDRVRRLTEALSDAQVPMSRITGLALAMLALEIMGSDYVEFNAHDFHKDVLALAPFVMWIREPYFARGETWAYDSEGKRFRTELDVRGFSSDEQADSTRAEITGVSPRMTK
jgi:hypothetical protein